MTWWLLFLGGSMLVMSAAALGFYAWDKRRAARGGWRVPERRLHWIALLGGWPGAMLGQRWLRHKTVKRRFRVVFWGTVLLHVLIAIAGTYIVWRFAMHGQS